MKPSDSAKEAVDALLGERQFEKAFEIALRWAEAGESWAMGSVGNFYLNGVGTDTDIEIGRAWLGKAITAGDALACHNLATFMTVVGEGSLEQVEELRRMAKERGFQVE